MLTLPRLIIYQLWQDYKATGETPVKSEPDLPSKGAIESLRARPMEALLEEFRENHPREAGGGGGKDPKSTAIPRCPLIELN